MKKVVLIVAALSAVCLGACKKEESKPVETKPPEVNPKPPEAEKAPEPAKPVAVEKIGVDECDRFLTAFSACVEKMPEASRGPSGETLKQMAEEWKGLAAQGDEMKETLKQSCKAALDGSAKAYESFCPGVKWE